MRTAPRVALRAALLLLHVSTLFSRSQAGEAEHAARAQLGSQLLNVVALAQKTKWQDAVKLVRNGGIKHCDSPGSLSADPACPLCWAPLKTGQHRDAEAPKRMSRSPNWAPGSSEVRLLGRCLPQGTAMAVGVMMAHWERTVRLTVAQA